jgi:hypothetical protein
MVLVTNSPTVTTGGTWAKSQEIRGFYSMECEDCCKDGLYAQHHKTKHVEYVSGPNGTQT